MKNLLKIQFVIVLVLMVFGCSIENIEESISNSNIEFLKNDKRFTDLIQTNIEIINNVVDFDKAKSLVEKEYLSKAELEELANAFGFKTFENYQNHINIQNAVLNDLNKEYDLESIEKNKFIELAAESIRKKEFNGSAKSSDCNCERIRRNCLIEVAAAAVLGNLACVSVDWTGIGAPICHGAVLILQIAASDNCNAEAENCSNDC